MPKKTKKQKLHAVDRRKPLVLRVPLIVKKSNDSIRILETSQQEKIIHSSSPQRKSSLFKPEVQSTTIFKKDLTKSLFITSVLILIQFGLFLSAQNNYFDISSVIHF